MNINSKKLKIKKDTRGRLIEIIKPQDVYNKIKGQILLTTAFPGQTKGNHYHKRKIEWYCVIKGKGLLTLTDNKTQKIKKVICDGTKPILIEIPRNHLHAITNIGDEEMELVIYIDEVFNPKDPDTYYSEVSL